MKQEMNQILREAALNEYTYPNNRRKEKKAATNSKEYKDATGSYIINMMLYFKKYDVT